MAQTRFLSVRAGFEVVPEHFVLPTLPPINAGM